MKRDFRDQYEKELKLLYERSADFAAEYPGIAERLGALNHEKMDPGLAALLEGTAFLAARVQLKLKSEYSQFTQTLLEQLLPNYLEPIPSAIMVEAQPDYEDKNLSKGLQFQRGEILEANYVELERRVSCNFQLSAPLTIWPLRIEEAIYHPSPAPLQALKIETPRGTKAGLQINIRRRINPPETDKEGIPEPGGPANELPIKSLTFFLSGTQADMDHVYEQIFANTTRVLLRYLDSFGDPHFLKLDPDSIEQLGFTTHEPPGSIDQYGVPIADALFPDDDRIFPGFDLVREYFVFPNKFAGFRVKNLKKALARIDADNFDLIFEFDTVRSGLKAVINRNFFKLHSAPAINLFELDCSRVPVKDNEFEHHVVPDRSRWLDYETHRIIDVQAHYGGATRKLPAFPIYQLPLNGQAARDTIFYASRRLPRLPTVKERRYGDLPSYIGTETYISIYEPATSNSEERVRELSVRAICSNRHLAEQLPIGEAGADFFLNTNTSVALNCIAGPTKPRDSIVYREQKSTGAPAPGRVMWQLVNLLNFNHLSLTDRNSKDPAAGLRDFLTLFSDMADSVSEHKIHGIVGLESRPKIRRLRQATGFNAARGIEITVTFDEKAYEGSGIMLLGAVLDRFFADHASMNSFTETVIKSVQRGEVKRWPPRSGTGRLI